MVAHLVFGLRRGCPYHYLCRRLAVIPPVSFISLHSMHSSAVLSALEIHFYCVVYVNGVTERKYMTFQVIFDQDLTLPAIINVVSMPPIIYKSATFRALLRHILKHSVFSLALPVSPAGHGCGQVPRAGIHTYTCTHHRIMSGSGGIQLSIKHTQHFLENSFSQRGWPELSHIH